jgi:penicillin-binding protein 1A
MLPMSLLRRRRFMIPALLALALLLGAGLGLAVDARLPSVAALRDWRPSTVTTIQASDGTVLARIGEEKRIVIEYRQIPPHLIHALVATEDAHFYRHFGVDPLGIARAAVSNVTSLKWRGQGGSTITQQLARNLFLKPDKTYARKIQEAILALQIEREYTKEEILTFYANQVYLGQGRYGVEAAAEYFFGRPARELSISQCALLAGLAQAPDRLAPTRHPDPALKRRAHVLSRMQEEGYITAREARDAGAEPLGLSPSIEANPIAPYFVEEVRRYLLRKYGEEALYRDGLTAETTLEPAAQRAAEQALRDGVLEMDRRRGFRRKWRNVAGKGPLDRYVDPSWSGLSPEADRVVNALVMDASAAAARLRVGAWSVTLAPVDVAWSGRLAMTGVMKPGDLVPLRVRRRLDAEKRLEVETIPWPDVEGAFVAIDSASGEIRALVGGFDFERSEFDRAFQARRQAGSAFKPFLFSVALDSGLTDSDTVFDEPTVFMDPQTKQPYQPENYYRQYYGRTTLREALEESRNIVAVLLLDRVGYKPVIDRARAMGITTPLAPYPSMALGSFEVSLLELTSAYSVFPNQGIRVEPHLLRRVRDRDGEILEEARPEIREVMKPETAFLMTWLLKGVVDEGTAAAARSLGRPLAGKTGTTDDYSDAWFVGFSPSLTCGVWVGTDRKESLGRGETGAKVALPIWMTFFETYLENKPVEEFARPGHVGFAAVDRKTGLRAGAETGCDPADVILDSFLEGSEPSAWCSPVEHFRMRLPYYLHRFDISPKLEIVAPPKEIAAVIQAGRSSIRLLPDGRKLEMTLDGGGTMTVPLALDSAGGRELQRLVAAPPPRPVGSEAEIYYGLDGRVATVREIHRD